MNLKYKSIIRNVLLKGLIFMLLSCEQTTLITSDTERPFCEDGNGLFLEMKITDASSFIETNNIDLNICDLPNIPTEASIWDTIWHPDLVTRRSSIKIPIADFEIEFEFWSSYIPQEIDSSNVNSITELTFEQKPFIYGAYEDWKEDFAFTSDSIYGLKGSLKESYAQLILRTDDQEFVSVSNYSLPDDFNSTNHNLEVHEISAIHYNDPEYSVAYTHIVEGTFNCLLKNRSGDAITFQNGNFRLPINFPHSFNLESSNSIQ